MNARPGFKRAQRKRMLISDATLLGLRMTSKLGNPSLPVTFVV